ncbi:hypothetical protein Vretimale_14865 [Volvox reticuliferus]|nr:hypothetical protein Vretimale_14865 [Volvox reticuliferus]
MDVSVLAALQEMFPTMPEEVLNAALEAHRDFPEDAINTLLELCSGNPDGESFRPSALTNNHTTGVLSEEDKTIGPSSVFSKEIKSLLSGKLNSRVPSGERPGQRHSRRGRSSSSGSRAGSAARMTWAQLRTEEHQKPIQLHQHQPPLRPQQSPQSPASQPPQTISPLPLSSRLEPKYVALGGGSAAAAAHLADTDFPDLRNHLSSMKTTKPNAEWHRSRRGASPGSRALTSASLSKSTMFSYSANDLQDLEARAGNLSFTSAPCSEGRGGSGGGQTDAAVTDRQTYGGYAAAVRCVPWPSVSAWESKDRYGMYDGGAAAAAGMGTEGGWEEAALEELCRSHPWAGRELVEAVCLALKYDLTEVVEALDELNAASYQYGNSGSSSSTASFSDDDDAGGNTELGNAAAAVQSYDFSPARQYRVGKRGDGGGGAAGTAAVAAAAVSGGHSCSEVTARGGDAYFRHRQSAIKMTHAWRKLMNKASAAFTAGDRALGRRLVSEAQDLRQQAAKAHREAAKRIVAEMNEGRQLSEWELDLHGLHAAEAVETLAQRIKSLEGGSTRPVATAAGAPAGPATAAATAATGLSSSGSSTKGQMQQQRTPIGSGGGGGGGSTAAAAAVAVSAEPTAPADVAAAAATAKLLASGRVLRVIVGKGLHSSGGEASLPRVVKNFLLDRGYRFTPRAGVIEVQLRRRFAVNSLPAIGAAADPTGAAAMKGK